MARVRDKKHQRADCHTLCPEACSNLHILAEGNWIAISCIWPIYSLGDDSVSFLSLLLSLPPSSDVLSVCCVLFFTPDPYVALALLPSASEAVGLCGSCSSRLDRLRRRGPCGPTKLFSCLLFSAHTAKLAPMLIVCWGSSVFPLPFAFLAHTSPTPSCSNIHDYIQYFYRSPPLPPAGPPVSAAPPADATFPPPQKSNQCQFFCDLSLVKKILACGKNTLFSMTVLFFYYLFWGGTFCCYSTVCFVLDHAAAFFHFEFREDLGNFHLRVFLRFLNVSRFWFQHSNNSPDKRSRNSHPTESQDDLWQTNDDVWRYLFFKQINKKKQQIFGNIDSITLFHSQLILMSLF